MWVRVWDVVNWRLILWVIQNNYLTSRINLKMTIMKHVLLKCFAPLGVMAMAACAAEVPSEGEYKPRVVILTDIAPVETEPDDMESMVRLLSHADLYEIEAIITASGWNSSGREYPEEWGQYLQTVIDAYEKDLPNLMKRSEQSEFKPLAEEADKQMIGYWPSADYLRSRVFSGSKHLGVSHIGADNVSPGSDYILSLAREDDERPLWVLVWGGGNTVAQSLWQARNSDDKELLGDVLDKIRIYTITDQDVDWIKRAQHDLSSHQWMREEFGDSLFFIWDESAWLSQNEIGAAHWPEYEQHIQGKGNMGAVYPRYRWGVEGDTPSFLYVMPTGLNDPENPSDISWGGYFKSGMTADSVTSCYTNISPEVKAVSRKYEELFYPAVFNNFAARMAWAHEGKGNRNPVAVVNGKKGLAPIVVNARGGESITLDASQSTDPDGDNINVKWSLLPEAGNADVEGVVIADPDSPKTELTLPALDKGSRVNVLCTVTDNGTPVLTSYRRVIIDIE